MKTSNLGLLLTLVIYISVALISIAMFGSEIQSVVLSDIGQAQHNGKAFWESYVTQISFMILLSCHIPFIFYAGKEGLLIMIDEMDRKSISNALWHKLYATNNKFEENHKEELPPAPALPVPGEAEPFLNIDKIMNPDFLRESRMTALTNAKTRLSMMTAETTNRLAYKDMKMSYYLTGTLIFYGVILVGSVFIKSVTIIFDFAAAFAITATAFVFQAFFIC